MHSKRKHGGLSEWRIILTGKYKPIVTFIFNIIGIPIKKPFLVSEDVYHKSYELIELKIEAVSKEEEAVVEEE